MNEHCQMHSEELLLKIYEGIVGNGRSVSLGTQPQNRKKVVAQM